MKNLKTRIKDNLKVGKPQVSPDKPTHVLGIQQGNSSGHYEKSPGHEPDGRSTARRSTGILPGKHEPIDPRMPNISPP
jgi:hypothetical protein